MDRDGDPHFHKLSIPGPTISPLIQRAVSASSDVDGLLFGHVTHSTPPSLSDAPTPTDPTPLFTATITSFLSSSAPLSFYDSLGTVHLPSLRRFIPPSVSVPSPTLLGFFVSRRSTPLRPSLREHAIACSLAQTLASLPPNANPDADAPLTRSLPPSPSSLLLLLISSSASPSPSIHTHEYRAFQLRRSRRSDGVLYPVLEPVSLDVINIGPAFRGHYGAFCPGSPFPWLPFGAAAEQAGGGESLSRMKQTSKEQQLLDACAEGFDVGRLSRLMGPEAGNDTSEVEELYLKMLANLEALARAVEKSSAAVLEQLGLELDGYPMSAIDTQHYGDPVLRQATGLNMLKSSKFLDLHS
ncbi:hypothetical protein ACLOJK_031356 [Asimina triloba]